MTNGFPPMRYEIIEDGQTICLTDCDVASSVMFGKRVTKMIQTNDLENGQRTIEFRDKVEGKFVKLSYELGEL